MKHPFTFISLFSGLGSGDLGMQEATARLGVEECFFQNLGGVDIDPLCCEDREYLTGAPSLIANIAEMKQAELRRLSPRRAPDAIFLSPPCKGLSGLLSKESAASEKYQQMNNLVVQGINLVLTTWDETPGLIVLENVPRIASARGAHLLIQVRSLLAGAGAVFHEGYHDCGEIGPLAQHRRRFLMVVRFPRRVGAYVYRPQKHRVRACGEVLGELPMPADPRAGELHHLPEISWLNWVRLALIPAGGDWRDLPTKDGTPLQTAQRKNRFSDQYKVNAWQDPAGAVTGSTDIQEGAQSIADVRLGQAVGLAATADGAGSFKGRPGLMGVGKWEDPAPTVTGKMSVSGGNGTAAIAQPLDLGLDHEPRRGTFGITPWTEPAPTVRGQMEVRQAEAAVADPRPLALAENDDRHWAKYRVTEWTEPAGAVTGSRPVTSGGPSVADPRLAELGMGVGPGTHHNIMAVTDWNESAGTVTGATRPGGGAAVVADPLVRTRDVPLRFKPWENSGFYGVMSWREAAGSVTGAAQFDNGRWAVADPRKQLKGPVPIIVAKDGTWHRPVSTLELAVLQSIPAMVKGKPLQLAGRSIAKKRERIGNAVPRLAGKAIGGTLLLALLASKLGTWTLGSTGIWVRKYDGKTEDQVNANLSDNPVGIESGAA